MGEDKNQKAKGMFIGGIVLIILAITADFIGIGGMEGFGWKQALFLILGIGLVVMSRKYCKCDSKGSSDSTEGSA